MNANALFEIVNKYYTEAMETERGQKLLATAKEDLGPCVYNIAIGDELVVNFVYNDGTLTIKEGRGEEMEGAMYVEAAMSEDLFFEIIEARQGFTEATANCSIEMKTVGVIWDFKTRPFISIWGTLTKIGQDLTVAAKVKNTNIYKK